MIRLLRCQDVVRKAEPPDEDSGPETTTFGHDQRCADDLGCGIVPGWHCSNAYINAGTRYRRKRPTKERARNVSGNRSGTKKMNSDHLLISQPEDALHPERVCKRLEDFMAWRMECVNSRQFDRLLASTGFSSAFRTTFANGQTGSLQDRVNCDIRIADQYPHMRLAARHSTSRIDIASGAAEVYSDVRVYGCPPGVVHQVLVVSQFILVNDLWQCVKAIDLRGSDLSQYANRQPMIHKNDMLSENDSIEDLLASQPSDKLYPEALGRRLELFMAFFAGLINQRKFKQAQRCPGFAPYFRSIVSFGTARKLDEHIDFQKRIAESYPSYHNEYTDLTSKVDLMNGTAQVFIHVQSTGWPIGVTLNSMYIAEFALQEDNWQCVRTTGIRGCAGPDQAL